MRSAGASFCSSRRRLPGAIVRRLLGLRRRRGTSTRGSSSIRLMGCPSAIFVRISLRYASGFTPLSFAVRTLVAGADQLEEHAGLGLALLDVGEVVEDQQMVLVELLDGGREPELLPRRLQLLDEVGGAGEQHAVAGVDQRVAEGCGEMRLADSGWARRAGCWCLGRARHRPRRAPRRVPC